jgi:hypothetical protein
MVLLTQAVAAEHVVATFAADSLEIAHQFVPDLMLAFSAPRNTDDPGKRLFPAPPTTFRSPQLSSAQRRELLDGTDRRVVGGAHAASSDHFGSGMIGLAGLDRSLTNRNNSTDIAGTDRSRLINV